MIIRNVELLLEVILPNWDKNSEQNAFFYVPIVTARFTIKIYVSGSFVSQKRLRKMADELWHLGHTVVGTWLQETAKPADMPQKTFYKQLAIKDLTEVKEADCIVMDVLDPSSTGGRYCEWGYSFGQQKLRYVVGPVKGVFDVLADKEFVNWEALLLFFQTEHKIKPYTVTTLTGEEVKQI